MTGTLLILVAIVLGVGAMWAIDKVVEWRERRRREETDRKLRAITEAFALEEKTWLAEVAARQSRLPAVKPTKVVARPTARRRPDFEPTPVTLYSADPPSPSSYDLGSSSYDSGSSGSSDFSGGGGDFGGGGASGDF